MLHDFGPYCPHAKISHTYSSLAHKLNGFVYQQNWLHNLLTTKNIRTRKIQRRKGEAFQIPVQPIIDTSTYEKFKHLRESKKTYQKRNIKYDYLIGGLLYCACNFKWGGRTNKTRHNRQGVLIKRITPIGIYYCRQLHKEHISPECPRHISSKKADAIVWEKVCEAIDNPEYLISMARKFVEELREKADSLYDEQTRIEKELDAIITERNWLITQAQRQLDRS